MPRLVDPDHFFQVGAPIAYLLQFSSKTEKEKCSTFGPMIDTQILNKPALYPQLEAKCIELGFSMPSDLYIGSLLKTLIASKPGGNFLELGTGIGLSLAWMIDGLDATSTLISLDNDAELIKIAQAFWGENQQLELICADGTEWIQAYQGPAFDLVFADAWPGKYSDLDELLALVKVGGLYVIDDMSPQPNWPEGHATKAEALIAYLEARNDLTLTKMNWSTGVIVAVKTGNSA